MNIVIYTDGSTRPNPGHSGWGAHGYAYAEPATQVRRIDDAILTNCGYRDKADLTDVVYPVKPIEFYDFCVYEAPLETNNYAELQAVVKVLTFFKDRDIQSLLIVTDSEYVRKGYMENIPVWIERGWRQLNGSPIVLAALWQRLIEIETVLRERGCTVSIEWVKRLQNYGNVLADQLATIATIKGAYLNAYEDYRVLPEKGYGRGDISKHPFICFKRMYFSSYESEDYMRYFIADPGDKDDLFGKRITDASYAVVSFKEPDRVLEMIKATHRTRTNNTSCTVLINLDRVYDKTIHPYLDYYGPECLIRANGLSNNLNFIDDRSITYEMVPTRLSLQAFENFSFLESLLGLFQNRTDEMVLAGQYHLFDITQHFFHMETKKTGTAHTLKPEYVVGYREKFIDLNEIISGRSVSLKIPLILGGDLLPRNQLKQIEDYAPAIYLMVWAESDVLYRYVCLVEVEGAVGIWSNYYSNKVLSIAQ